LPINLPVKTYIYAIDIKNEKESEVRIQESEYPMSVRAASRREVRGFKQGILFFSSTTEVGGFRPDSSTSRTEFNSEFWLLTPEFFFGNF